MSDEDEAKTVPLPRENPDLVGHEGAEQALLAAWHSGRMPHAWLLAGPRGIGKATLAFRMARFVLAAEEGGLFGPAETDLSLPADHSVFRRVARGAHPDLQIGEPSWNEKKKCFRTEITVHETRALGDFLHLTPAEGGWRVVVVDSADDMNRNAANALLKVLEEPPARALLLLVSHAPGRLLPTIRSRCRRLDLKALPEATVASLLRRHRPDLNQTDAALLARLAGGSIGRAIELGGKDGADLFREVAALLLELPRLDGLALHRLGDRLGRAGGDGAFRTAAEFLSWWLARLVRAGSVGQVPDEVLPGEEACIRRLLSARRLDQWLELWDKVTRLLARTESANLDRKQVWVAAMLDIAGHARA